jgi:hypothetical protein
VGCNLFELFVAVGHFVHGLFFWALRVSSQYFGVRVYDQNANGSRTKIKGGDERIETNADG